MADPDWTDAERDDIHDALGYALGLGGVPLALEFLFHPQANQCLVDMLDEEARTIISNWKITTCAVTTDTDDESMIFVRVQDEDPGVGQAKLYFYKETGRTTLIATAAGSDSTTLTITPETGYTLAGTVDIGAVGAGNDAHDFCIHVNVPPAQRLQQLYPGTETDDAQIRDEGLRRVAAMRAAFAGARGEAQAFGAFLATTKVRRNLVGPDSSLLSVNRRIVSHAIEETYTGILENLRAAQEDNTGGSAEVKAAAVTLSGSVTFPGWTGTASGPTYGQRGVPADIVWRCVKKLTNTPPQFQATRTTTDTRRRPNNGTGSEEMTGRLLTIGAEWSAKEWGIEALTVNYTASVTNVTSALLSTTATDWSVTGLTSSNSTEGVLYARYDGSTLKFYKTSAGRTAVDADDVVAQATLATTDDATTFTATGATGISIVGKTGAGSSNLLVSGSTGDLSFQCPTVTGGSLFRLTIAESGGGEWQKRMRDGGVGGLNYTVNTGSSPNLTDAQVRAGLPLINIGVSGARY